MENLVSERIRLKGEKSYLKTKFIDNRKCNFLQILNCFLLVVHHFCHFSILDVACPHGARIRVDFPADVFRVSYISSTRIAPLVEI